MKKSNRKRFFDDEDEKDDNVTEKLKKKISYEDNQANLFELSNNKSFENLGFLTEQENNFEWDAKKETQFINLVEHVNWLYNSHENVIKNLDYPESTFEPLDLNNQYDFVSKEILDGIIFCKTALTEYNKNDIRRAKSSSNPFESISKCIFQNRSALKMANLDFMFNYLFTSPKLPLYDEKDILYFADLCGGPGGFTEYVFWKKKWEAKGFGLTLKKENDFNLEKFSSTSLLNFHRFYGELNDGDIYKPQNLVSFRNYVLCNTEKRGVHFAMGDGAFSVEGKEGSQEVLSKRIYLCQFVCALSILRTGGNFVCKVFDLFTHFSVGLIYLMHRCFKQMSIVKPNTSRPANSERYIVFKNKLDNCEEIENFLFKINCSLDSFENLNNEQSSSSSNVKEDFHELIPFDIIQQDRAFYNYIYDSNIKLGKRQIHFLCKERAFASNPELIDNRKNNLRRKCLNQWKIPTRIINTSNSNLTPQQKFENFMNEHNINISKCAFLYYESKELKKNELTSIQYPYNYYFTTLTENRDNDSQRGIFLSFKNNVYFFDTVNNQWKPVKIDKLKFPDNTLLYGEITSEFKGEGSGQKKVVAFHIIDALILGDLNISSMPITKRVLMAEKMIKALSLNNNKNLFIRAKVYFQLPDIENYFLKLDMKECKGIRKERICLEIDEEYFVIASGLLIYNNLKKPWGSCISKSTDKLYYFNYKSNSSSVFNCPKEAVNDFITCFTERLFWKWQSGKDLLPPDELNNEPNQSNTIYNQNKITRKIFCDHLEQVLKPK